MPFARLPRAREASGIAPVSNTAWFDVDHDNAPATWTRHFRVGAWGLQNGQSGVVPGALDDDLAYFRERGDDVRIEERDLHALHMARGEPGQASFFAEGRSYHVVDLLRSGRVVAPAYGVGETPEDALAGARRRYGSEQE